VVCGRKRIGELFRKGIGIWITHFSVVRFSSETASNFLFGLMTVISGFVFSGNL
jgi:hypothetical protein